MDNFLEEEQEKVFASLSQVLPGFSSQETLLNPEEVEKIRSKGETVAVGDEGKKARVKRSVPSTKSKRGCPLTGVKRKRGKPRKKKKEPSGAGKEENDSGFGTSSEVVKYTAPDAETTQHSDSEDSATSLESVSLLQIANNSTMEVDGVSDGVSLAWNVKIFPPLDDDDEDMETKNTSDKAVQTVHVPHPAAESIMRTVNFVSSVIRLKRIYSSRTNITRNELEMILKRLPEEESCEEASDDSDEMEVVGDGMPFIAAKRRKDVVSCETVRYVLRRTNAEELMEKSVDAILAWLKEETEKDWRTVCCYWDGSMTADAVDILNEAVDSDVIGIRKKVSDFLGAILEDIHEGQAEDTVQEFKVAFLSNFCKSILLQYDLISRVHKKLSGVVSTDWVNTPHEMQTAKKTYFTLRLLQDLLRSFLTDINTNRWEEIFRTKPKHADAGVLNMWKTNWKRAETFSNDITLLHSKYLNVIRKWCNLTDFVLSFSLKECPLLSLVAQKCSTSARQILSKMQTVLDEKPVHDERKIYSF